MLVSKYSNQIIKFCGTISELNSKYIIEKKWTVSSWNSAITTRGLKTITSSRNQKVVIASSEQQEYSNRDEIKPVTIESLSDFTIEEVRIPTIGGFIAGKLWKGSQADSTKQSPLLCMHGWLDNAGSFDTLLPLIMKPNMTALAIDFPGHGFSSYSVPPIHYDAHMESILAIHSILQYYDWKKFTILGHSLGAIVGFVLAGVFPEIVDKFIALENVRPIPKDCKTVLRYSILKLLDLEKKRQQQLQNANTSTAAPAIPSYTFDEIVDRFFKGRDGTISLDACKILMKRGAIPLGNPLGYYRFAHDIKATYPTGLWRFSPSHTEEIARDITCPVCFIKGEPGGDYEPREKYNQIVQLMQWNNSNRVEYHHIEGTHHFHINNPFPVAPIITKFLEESS